MTLEFRKRGRRMDTAASRRLAYFSACQQWRLEKVEITGLAIVWRVCHLTDGQWRIASRHRTRQAAEKAAQLHQRKAER